MNNDNDIFDDDNEEFSTHLKNFNTDLNNDELELLYNTEELGKMINYVCKFLSPRISTYAACKIISPKN